MAKENYKSFEILDIKELLLEYNSEGVEDLDTTEDRIQCYCPFCIEKGEPNSKTTLYIYPKTLSFYCFRCHTSGMDVEAFKDPISFKIKKLQDSVRAELNKSDLILHDTCTSHLKPITSLKYKKYFASKRSPKYLLHLEKWQLKEIKFMRREGIFIPFIYFGKVVNYQIRFLEDGNRKYLLEEGEKVPYFVNGYTPKTDYSEITLVEGVFDAMAADIFKLPNPIAILGSAITDTMYDIITKLLKPKKIIFAFDDMAINRKLSRKFNKYFADQSFLDTKGEDLDEYLRLGKSLPPIRSRSSMNEYFEDKKLKNLLQNIIKRG